MKYKLSELSQNVTDGEHGSVKDNKNGECFLLSCKNIKNGKIEIGSRERRIDVSTKNRLNKRTNLEIGDILITTVGTIGEMAMIRDRNIYYSFQRSVGVIKPNQTKVIPEYLYYAIMNESAQINTLIKGAVQKCLFINDLKSLRVDIPDLETQQKVVRILSALDEKIELNNDEKQRIQDVGKNIYVNKFEKDPSLEKVALGDFLPVRTGKKDANANSPDGAYPFFTCSQAISRIADYSFDDDAILLAGNGDFNVKFYRGKFDAYQRTYVLIPKDKKLLGFLYWAISCNLPRITANYRGSVIKFITKGNIENFKVPFADNEYVSTMMTLLAKIESIDKENDILIKTRDALLPKLMSGEINLDKVR